MEVGWCAPDGADSAGRPARDLARLDVVRCLVLVARLESGASGLLELLLVAIRVQIVAFAVIMDGILLDAAIGKRRRAGPQQTRVAGLAAGQFTTGAYAAIVAERI